MNIDELTEGIEAFFADKSRSASATKTGLLDLAAHCEMLADAIPDDDAQETLP